MIVIDPDKTPVRDFHQFLLGAVAPRPIAFVSTMDEKGQPNLAPYSFYNAFSSNPPTLVFSSNRRVIDNTTKDTLHNIMQTRECVINVVNYAIVRQMTISSIQFDKDISEFDKSGLTPVPSDLVQPFRVKESPVQMECKVQDIIALGEHGGAGHLIICKVVRMHVQKDILDENNRIDPHKIDLMGRLGRAYYVRASGDAIHTIVQPVTQVTIGYDRLPESFKLSRVLSANDLGMLSGIQALPDKNALYDMEQSDAVKAIISESEEVINEMHSLAKNYLAVEKRMEAAAVLMVAEKYNS